MVNYKILVKDIFLDTLWEVLYFPLWWYSQGLKKAASFCLGKISHAWRMLALVILLRNFFKPMYGSRGWDAFLLSIASHTWQIFWRLILFLVWSLFWIAALIIWLILPVASIMGIFTL